MKNNEVLDLFLIGVSAKNSSKNLISDGKSLLNYNTEIARHYGGITLVNGKKYSSTTSKHQNYLRNNSFCVILPEADYKYITNLEYDIAYDMVQAMYNIADESCVDLTDTRKKSADVVNEGNKILYANKK